MPEKVKKPNIFKRLGNHFAKSWSELKKVTWPSFPTVVRNILVVLAVTLVFLIVITASDALWSFLFNLITG